jgi:hypothetical protein
LPQHSEASGGSGFGNSGARESTGTVMRAIVGHATESLRAGTEQLLYRRCLASAADRDHTPQRVHRATMASRANGKD